MFRPVSRDVVQTNSRDVSDQPTSPVSHPRHGLALAQEQGTGRCGPCKKCEARRAKFETQTMGTEGGLAVLIDVEPEVVVRVMLGGLFEIVVLAPPLWRRPVWEPARGGDGSHRIVI